MGTPLASPDRPHNWLMIGTLVPRTGYDSRFSRVQHIIYHATLLPPLKGSADPGYKLAYFHRPERPNEIKETLPGVIKVAGHVLFWKAVWLGKETGGNLAAL